MASLRFTKCAESDLLEAWLYVAEDNIGAADHMLDQIDSQARLLLAQPLMGRSRDELAPGLRSWPSSTPYLLFYFQDKDGIIIARVLHHARDVPNISNWPEH